MFYFIMLVLKWFIYNLEGCLSFLKFGFVVFFGKGIWVSVGEIGVELLLVFFGVLLWLVWFLFGLWLSLDGGNVFL